MNPPTIRPATPDDAAAVADLFWRVRTESVPRIPMIAHPRTSVGPFVRDVLMREFEVWLVEDAGTPVGFMALMPPDQLAHLYIDEGHTGEGLGSRLVALAQTRFPEGLQLWTFQSNDAAQRFYARHGFVAVESSDGDNDEESPDVRMVWTPQQREPGSDLLP